MTSFQRNNSHKHRQPSKHTHKRVRDAFDPEMLKHICTTWDFESYARRVDLPARNGRERFFYYMDNGSDVLAIAHLDSVQKDVTCTIMDTESGPLVASGALDDRLGVYVILDMLPKLGITCDWLLTTDEEIGASTAEEFFPEHKQYNWMIQFDRGGTDVVMYQYETAELCELVADCGARVGTGSFSDICMLDHLGCAGFNWGVGYEDYHGPRSHAWLEDTFRMVARFVKFHKANASKRFNYEERDWWEMRRDALDIMMADCNHEIDLDDLSSYVESDDGSLECSDCANPQIASGGDT